MSDESRGAFETLWEREAPKLEERFDPRDADLFWVRLERYFEDAYLPLLQLYGDRPDWPEQFTAIFDSVVDAYLARPEPLRPTWETAVQINPAYLKEGAELTKAYNENPASESPLPLTMAVNGLG
jgi:hypothetical protein